jgi:ligand-binding sensor domain-containing protein
MKYLVLLLLFINLNEYSSGQQIQFDKMSISEGLSSNSIYCIFQDSRGVIWIGSLDGLHRYDGYSLKIYKHNTLDPKSLSNNRITSIYEDSRHHLWLYDEFTSAMNRYIPEKGEFVHYYLDQLAGGELEVLDSIYEEPNGNILLKSKLGYQLRYVASKGSFEILGKGPRISDDWNDKPAWRDLLQHFGHYLKSVASSFNTHTIVIRKIFRDSEDRFWIATKFDGLYTATNQNGRWQFVSHIRNRENSKVIPSEEVNDIFEDRYNVIWISTKTDGLYTYSKHKYKFEHLKEVILPEGSYSLGRVRAIAEDASKNLWISVNDQGLLKANRTDGTGVLYKPENGNTKSLGHRFIRTLWISPDKQLWIGHYDGFSLYHPLSDNFTQYHFANNRQHETRVFDFERGKDNTYWIAGWDVIMNFDKEKNQFKVISRSESKGIDFISENIREVLVDDEGELWIAAGEKGISIYDKHAHRFTTLRANPSNPNGLPSNNIYDIYKDSRKNIWVATADGLCSFDYNRMRFKTYTVNDGLPSNFILGMLEDRRGFLWLSTTKGISKFNPSNGTFKNYDVSDGLQSNEFTENAFFKNEEGVMFFGGTNGINIFHPDHAPDNPTPPQAAITNLKVYDKPLAEVESFDTEKINQLLLVNEAVRLGPQQRYISVEFVAYHYVNPQKNSYAYMLEGLDEEWTYRDANARFANYTNLEPGNYTFKLKVANSDGVWSDEVITLPIIVEPPFYTASWFIFLIIASFLLLGLVTYKRRIELVKRQQSMKAMQLESELNFLRSQVNPHFLFNTLNNIYALCQVNSRNAAPMVGKVSEMMRYMIYDCNAHLVLLQKEIEYLQNYIDLNLLKTNKKLNVSFQVKGDVSELKIAPLLLINFLENSFKHGDTHSNDNGFIDAQIIIDGVEMRFIIINSFKEKRTYKGSRQGIGIENVKHRLNLLYPDGHELRIEKNIATFEVQLKLRLN